MLNTDVAALPLGIDTAIRALPFVLVGFMLKDWLLGMKMSRMALNAIAAVSVYVICFLCYYVGFSPKETFKNGEIMSPCLSLFYMCALSGSFAVIALCIIVGKIRVLGWLGRNSLVIMCVHFPLFQWLNSYVAQTSYYLNGGVAAKFCISIFIVTVGLCFGSGCAVLCKHFVPKYTGYKKNFESA